MSINESVHIQMKHFRILDFSFRNDFIENKFTLIVNIKPTFDFGTDNQGNRICVAKLIYSISNEKKTGQEKEHFFLSTTVEGLFVSSSNKIDKATFRDNCLVISLSSLMPIVRSYIISFTAQAGMNTLKLPLVDVRELIKAYKTEKEN